MNCLSRCSGWAPYSAWRILAAALVLAACCTPALASAPASLDAPGNPPISAAEASIATSIQQVSGEYPGNGGGTLTGGAVNDSGAVEAGAVDLEIEPCCRPRTQDEQWLVSTRHLGCCADLELRPPVVHRLVDGCWERRDLTDLITTGDPQRTVTLIYVHGNRVDANDAVRRGNQVYQKLAPYAPAEMALRFVTFSWPSDQVHGQLQDVRIKAQRTNLEGYNLGWLLARFEPDARVSLLGYSFGARIATGGLHVLGGGRLAGRALDAAPLRLPVRVTLTAAAVDRRWIVPGSVHGRALQQADAMLLFYNRCDPVLQRYHRLEKRGRPVALGYTGIGRSTLGMHGGKLEQYDVCSAVGKSHAEANYYASCWMLERMAANLLWESTEAL